MKSFRRTAALTIAAAAAIGGAYVGWSGSAAVVAKRTQTAIVAVAGRASGLATDALAPDALGASDGCPFCLKGTDLAAFHGEPPDILAQPTLSGGLADFGDSVNGPAALMSDATAAPASEISTAAMAMLGAIGLTAWGGRRKGRPSWQEPWRSPTIAESF